ncbi:hypothetical protein E2K93_14990 [Thalassotalea sp. HSM 43]|uniref:hypothetical protein n=1 Tax=Thalassotalea sp. HSM 43 TaxID=2552945 RepID=UPI00108215A4|nr:hypothetical protein [Thalassotalea sp. HSM 43]QBY05595.1 hypothetical protein E2K93_14990 [Thalassotalea sp. HSM 43]
MEINTYFEAVHYVKAHIEISFHDKKYHAKREAQEVEAMEITNNILKQYHINNKMINDFNPRVG